MRKLCKIISYQILKIYDIMHNIAVANNLSYNKDFIDVVSEYSKYEPNARLNNKKKKDYKK